MLAARHHSAPPLKSAASKQQRSVVHVWGVFSIAFSLTDEIGQSINPAHVGFRSTNQITRHDVCDSFVDLFVAGVQLSAATTTSFRFQTVLKYQYSRKYSSHAKRPRRMLTCVFVSRRNEF